jgi:type IV/VI secretion system ImpK/VasF family protein
VGEEAAAMSDEGFGPNRTFFRPSPLQSAREAPAAQVSAGPPGRQGDDVPAPAFGQRRRNPLMAEASAILALVANLRAGRARTDLRALHRQAITAIGDFERAIAGHYPPETIHRARYAVCATVDDVALNLPDQGADTAQYAQRTMVVKFFSEAIGGDRFWLLLDEMTQRPSEFRDLLELYHACMAAGFEGRYRMAGGRQTHQARMEEVYRALDHTRSLSMSEVSPHWRGETAPARTAGIWGPVAMAGGAAAAFLLVVFLALNFALIQQGAGAVAALARLDPDNPPMQRWRPAPVLAPPTGDQARQISDCLRAQSDAGQLTVDQTASSVRIRTTDGQLFKSGSDQLESRLQPLFGAIARCIDEQPGPVRVEGYTDSDKVRGTLEFPDNQALSKARAETAARLIRSALKDPSRVTPEGYGADNPIAPGNDAAAKALNRRVEIVLNRTS